MLSSITPSLLCSCCSGKFQNCFQNLNGNTPVDVWEAAPQHTLTVYTKSVFIAIYHTICVCSSVCILCSLKLVTLID